jgi:hypothetical protein
MLEEQQKSEGPEPEKQGYTLEYVFGIAAIVSILPAYLFPSLRFLYWICVGGFVLFVVITHIIMLYRLLCYLKLRYLFSTYRKAQTRFYEYTSHLESLLTTSDMTSLSVKELRKLTDRLGKYSGQLTFRRDRFMAYYQSFQLRYGNVILIRHEEQEEEECHDQHNTLG